MVWRGVERLVVMVEWMERVVSKGKIIRFNDTQGYGFIGPDDGGRDVFVHANVLEGNPQQVLPGTVVEYESVEGDRGLKAVSARILEAAPRSAERTRPAGGETTEVADGMCDVLTTAALGDELIGLFLDEVPTLTGAQMTQLRGSLVRLAQRHGWTD